MELIYAGFEILPTNISQAIALASLVGDELVHAWRSVIESIEPDKITHKSIRSLLFPPNELDLPSATIRVTPTLHETIHREAADLGISIPEFLWTILQFFVSGGNSHLSQYNISTEDYARKEQIWRADLQTLIQETT